MARDRFSTQVDTAVAARVRRTVVGLQGSGQPQLTLAAFVEAALAAACDDAVDRFNSGIEFDPPAGPLRTAPVRAPHPVIPAE